MIDLEGTRNVSIGGNVYHIKVRRKSNSAWVAIGEYDGEVLTAEARSAFPRFESYQAALSSL